MQPFQGWKSFDRLTQGSPLRGQPWAEGFQSRWDSRMVGLATRRVARPRIEDGGQHQFILQRWPGRRRYGFKRLQRIRHDPGATTT
jgi:hypothetical protein